MNWRGNFQKSCERLLKWPNAVLDIWIVIWARMAKVQMLVSLTDILKKNKSCIGMSYLRGHLKWVFNYQAIVIEVI